MAKTKRRDKSRVVLRTGESQRADGTYHYSWTDANRKRRYVYAKTLDELRYKEEQIEKDKKDGIKAEARYTTLNDMYELWKDLKRGLKNNTFENYKYMYETFVRNQIGSKTVSSLKKTDIKRFYNYLADERHLKPATIDNIHTVLHQILDMAVDDDYLRNNPSNNVLKELKQSHCFQTEKRRALTRPEQELFLSYLKNTPSASLWYPIFAVLVGTGLRVGEATGLRWCDIDLDEGIINVNHTLVYYDHRTDGSKRGCYFNINTTKTPAGKRQVPMLDFVKEAFLMEKERQELLDIHCEAVVDGYTDFIFLNRFGQPQHQATLNKAIRRIIRDCNDEQLLKDENAKVLLPHFSCHSLRHPYVKHTTKIFSLRLMDFQAQAYPDARRKTRGACQLHRGGQSRSPVRPLCNRKRFSCLPPQSKMSWILYAISMHLSGYTSTRSISSSASSVVSVSASKIALDASLRLSCRACSFCFCCACANTAA